MVVICDFILVIIFWAFFIEMTTIQYQAFWISNVIAVFVASFVLVIWQSVQIWFEMSCSNLSCITVERVCLESFLIISWFLNLLVWFQSFRSVCLFLGYESAFVSIDFYYAEGWWIALTHPLWSGLGPALIFAVPTIYVVDNSAQDTQGVRKQESADHS
jgi:hypothetical protein